LVPARQVKILARPAGSYAADPWTTLWIGYVDAVSAPWRTATTSNATLRCVDALARLSRIDPLKVSMPREPINTRVNRIFDMAGWTGGRNLTGSSSFMVKPSTADRNLLDEAQITTLGAMQFVYADRTNTLCTKLLYGTTANFFHVTNNPAANNPAGTWCPNLPIDFPGASAEKVYNRINLANAGLANKAYDNASSQAAYGLRPYTRSDLMGEDVGNDNLGPLLLNHYAWQRPGNVTYDIDLPFGVTKGPALGLAGVELQDQIWTDLKIDPIDGPPWTTTGVNKSYVLIGLAHSITDTQWTVSLTCDQITSTEPAALTEPEPEPEQEMAWH
jgi:hypothetical protein